MIVPFAADFVVSAFVINVNAVSSSASYLSVDVEPNLTLRLGLIWVFMAPRFVIDDDDDSDDDVSDEYSTTYGLDDANIYGLDDVEYDDGDEITKSNNDDDDDDDDDDDGSDEYGLDDVHFGEDAANLYGGDD